MRRILLLLLVIPPLLLGIGVALVWAPDRSVAELSARWAPSPSAFVRVDAHTLHLRDEGPRADTLPLVLLHGTSASLHTWDGWVDSLRSTRRVIRFDLPGFGLTGPAADDDYSVRSYAELVVAVMDSLRVERAVVVGNSLGGQIAVRTAGLALARVAALVLVDPAGFPFASESVPIAFRIARAPGAAWLLTRILPRSVVRSSVENVYGDPSLVSEELVDRYYELSLREGNRAALPLRFAQEMDAGWSDTLLIRSVKAPTLILWGEEDRLIPIAHAERFARDIVGSRVVRYAGVGHVPHEEIPAQTVSDVLAFLRATFGT